ncbi:MAG: hypothetical protein WCB10_07890 [Steroidobacteraceae bacterium]
MPTVYRTQEAVDQHQPQADAEPEQNGQESRQRLEDIKGTPQHAVGGHYGEKGRPALVADKIGDDRPWKADDAREHEEPQHHVGAQCDDKQ